jgi:hypothetical protein
MNVLALLDEVPPEDDEDEEDEVDPVPDPDPEPLPEPEPLPLPLLELPEDVLAPVVLDPALT